MPNHLLLDMGPLTLRQGSSEFNVDSLATECPLFGVSQSFLMFFSCALYMIYMDSLCVLH